MHELGWQAAIQAVLVALSTWYVRRGSKKDSTEVKRTTAVLTQIHSDEIGERISYLETNVRGLTVDMELVKRVVLHEPHTKGGSHGSS